MGSRQQTRRKYSGDVHSFLNEVRGEEQQVTVQSRRQQWQLLQPRRGSISGWELLQCVKTGLETKLSCRVAELRHSFCSHCFTIGHDWSRRDRPVNDNKWCTRTCITKTICLPLGQLAALDWMLTSAPHWGIDPGRHQRARGIYAGISLLIYYFTALNQEVMMAHPCRRLRGEISQHWEDWSF